MIVNKMLLQKHFGPFSELQKFQCGDDDEDLVSKFHHLFLQKDVQALPFEGCSKLTLNRRKIAQFQVPESM